MPRARTMLASYRSWLVDVELDFIALAMLCEKGDLLVKPPFQHSGFHSSA